MILLKRIVIGEAKGDTAPLFVEADAKEAMRLVESGAYRLASPAEQNQYAKEKQQAKRLEE